MLELFARVATGSQWHRHYTLLNNPYIAFTVLLQFLEHLSILLVILITIILRVCARLRMAFVCDVISVRSTLYAYRTNSHTYKYSVLHIYFSTPTLRPIAAGHCLYSSDFTAAIERVKAARAQRTRTFGHTHSTNIATLRLYIFVSTVLFIWKLSAAKQLVSQC